MAFAENHGQIRRCHNLVWEWQIPGWIATTSWTRDSLIATMTKHITEEVTHYRGQCYAWDVVNEPLFDNGTLRDTIFHRVIGPDYIAIAFKAAAAADPNAKLYFNDYGIESPGSKATGALALVDSLQQAGAPIHGVGFESHFIVGETPCRKDQAAVMAAFASKNVEVAVTELDIRIQDDQVTRATHIQQAVDYASTVGACLDSPNCVGLTVWDFTDKVCFLALRYLKYSSHQPAFLFPRPSANPRSVFVDSHLLHWLRPRVSLGQAHAPEASLQCHDGGIYYWQIYTSFITFLPAP